MGKKGENYKFSHKTKARKIRWKPNTKVNCILMSDFTVFIALKTQILPLFSSYALK